MPNQPKKHHYVPQSLLRRFSVNNDGSSLYVFDKTRLESFKSSILNAGSENHFHSIEIEGKIVSFEGLFQSNDDQLARLLNTVINDRSLKGLTSQDRVALTEVAVAQIVRTKMARTTMRSFAEQFAVVLQEAGIEPKEVDGFSIPTEQEVRRAALSSFLDIQKHVDALRAKRQILIHATGSETFWISDNPVVLHNTFPYGELGLASPGIEIYFPISSELALGFFCPSIKLKIQQALSLKPAGFDLQKYTEIYRGFQTGDSISFGKETVPFLNSLQVTRSSRFLYASKNDFDYARQILQLHPEAQDVRSLFSVGRLGQGLPPRLEMPPGLWIVFYGNKNHYMIEVDSWVEDSAFLEFETSDAGTLRAILEDQPLNRAILFQDGFERMGMLEAQIEVLREYAPFYVRITHRNEALNHLLGLLHTRNK